MGMIKVKFKSRAIASGEGCIYYQVVCDGVTRKVNTSHRLFANEWDSRRGKIAATADASRRDYLRDVNECVKHDVERLSRIVGRFEKMGIAGSSYDIGEEFQHYSDQLSLRNYMEKCISRLKKNGKITTAGHYRSALNSFMKFLASTGMADIMLDRISAGMMADYEAYLQVHGVQRNSTSAYMRSLRSVYNKAVDDDIIEQRNPFRHVYTGIEKTVKRAVTLKLIGKIRSLDLSDDPTLDFARDMFVLGFYFRGMSFVDMSFLKKSNLANSQLVYRRRKTGQQLTIKWTREMQMILDKYPDYNTGYLLPIIRSANLNEYYAYRNASARVNKGLKIIGRMVGCPIALTHYVARHSWASGALASGVRLSVISEGMGHDNETTTRIYLASLDSSSVDRANDKMIRSINNC